MRDIGKNIRDIRTQKGLTQDALAELLFVTRQTVSNYETGKSRPDIDMLLRIAETLEIDIHVILYGPQPRDNTPIIRLFPAGGITLGLGMLWLVSRAGREDEYYNFVVGPMTYIYSFSQPFFFALLGWTLAQGIGILTKAKPPRFPASKWVGRLLLGILILWVLLLIGQSASRIGLPRFLYTICIWAMVCSLRYPWIFLFPGIGLWLCGFPAKRE